MFYVVVIEGHGDFAVFETAREADRCVKECEATFTEENGYSADLETEVQIREKRPRFL